MRRILFLIPSFQLGGTNSALNNFLSKIDKKRFMVDVYAFNDSGPNRQVVSKYAHIIGGESAEKSNGSQRKVSLKDVVRSVKRFLIKLHIDISPLAFRRVARQLSANGYDSVIAFQEGQTTKFLSYFRNTYKIAWVHCDYKDHIAINRVKPEKDIYSKIDKIVCVSKYTRSSFLSVLPEMEAKTEYLYNAMDVESILRRSKESTDIDFVNKEGIFNLVSIGRLDPVKRFDYIPEIASKIKASGLCFKWYIIGNGPEEYKALICSRIKQHSVEDSVVCLGAKSNPYPYIVGSDIVVITSSSEACPIVLNEAKVLQIPVVTTNYGSSYEFIEDGENGMIRPIEEIPNALLQLMKDHVLYNTIKHNLANYEYPNESIISYLEGELLK